MALPLGRVKGPMRPRAISSHHSGAALPAERDVQKRFLNGASKWKSVSNSARDFAENSVLAVKNSLT